jgi:hypothetical protein
MRAIHVVVDVRANRRVHVPKDGDVPLRIEVARGDAVLRGYLCKIESVGRVGRACRRSYGTLTA